MIENIGITRSGFICPTFGQIMDQYRTLAQVKFGIDVDLSPASPLGQILTVVGYQQYLLWQSLEDIYYSGYINFAGGQNLDRFAELVGMERNPATWATGDVTFTGVAGTEIPEGFEVSNSAGTLVYKTLAPIIIGDDNTGTGRVVCKTIGAVGNVATGVINRQSIPMAGIWSVTNPEPTYNGSERETDAGFRYRIKTYASLAKDKGTKAALEIGLLSIDGVVKAKVTDDPAPGYVTAVVAGGLETDIERVIESTRSAGIVVAMKRPTTAKVDIALGVIKNLGEDIETLRTTIKSEIERLFADKDIGEALTYSEIVETIVSVKGVKTITSLTVTSGATTITSFGQKIDFADETVVPVLNNASITIA